MFRSQAFFPVIIATLLVVVTAFLGLLLSPGACGGSWSTCAWVPVEVLLGQYQAPHNSSWLLLLAQHAGKLAFAAGAVLTAIRFAIATARHDFRVATARRKKNHVIVCGLGSTGLEIVRHMRTKGDVVVIDKLDGSDEAAFCDREGIPVIKGTGTDPGILRAAGIGRAHTAFICTGDDAVNLEVALRVRDQMPVQVGRPPLTVLAEMRDQWLYAKLIEQDRQALGRSHVDLRLFNTRDNAARLLIGSLKIPPGPEIDPGAAVIIGLGQVGQELLVQLVRASPAALGSTTKLIVFDKDAERRRDELLNAYPALPEVAAIEFVSLDFAQDTTKVWSSVEDRLRGRPLLCVAVCLGTDEDNLYTALSLRTRLDELARVHTPIFVQLEKHRHLGEFAGSLTSFGATKDRIRVFGGLQELLRPDILIDGRLDRLARAFHEFWLASIEPGQDAGPAAKPWDDLPESFKVANRRRADLLALQLSQAGLRIVPASEVAKPLAMTEEDLELLARLEHRRWSIDRRLMGYSFAEVRSEAPRRHNLLVEWEELSEQRRQANRADILNIPRILAALELALERDRKILVGKDMGAGDDASVAFLAGIEENSLIIADLDTAEGRAAAEKASEAAGCRLWLVCDGDIDAVPAGISKSAWEQAAGRVGRSQLRIRNGSGTLVELSDRPCHSRIAS